MNDPNLSPIILHSNWKAMRIGFLGWLILSAGAVGLYYLWFLVRTSTSRFDEWRYLQYVVFIGLLLYLAYEGWGALKRYLPSRWKTIVKLYLDKKEIVIIVDGKSSTLPFADINRVIYQGSSPIFTTYYFYWVETAEKQIPLLAFTNEQESNKFYDTLERQARLTVVQKPSSL